MTRPICVQHSCWMVPDKNGVIVVEPGYRAFRTDRYECPIGHEKVISSFGAAIPKGVHGFDEMAADPNALVIPR